MVDLMSLDPSQSANEAKRDFRGHFQDRISFLAHRAADRTTSLAREARSLTGNDRASPG
jgi:hypothetical protein